MNENYIVINGKKIELTEEQLKQLGIESEKKRKNPFDRVAEEYWYVKADGIVDTYTDRRDSLDNALYWHSNYFNDKAFAEQVALHQLLYRKLLKFAYDNECEDTAEWDGSNHHWVIKYDKVKNSFTPDWHCNYKEQVVYFSSVVAARRAIKEVVEPFIKEHPDFVW